MTRTGMRKYNLALLRVSVVMGLVITTTLIISIRTEMPGMLRTACSAGVVLAACGLNLQVNTLAVGRLGRSFPNLCYGMALIATHGSLVLVLPAIWDALQGQTVWKSPGTLLVLLFGALLASALGAVSARTAGGGRSAGGTEERDHS